MHRQAHCQSSRLTRSSSMAMAWPCLHRVTTTALYARRRRMNPRSRRPLTPIEIAQALHLRAHYVRGGDSMGRWLCPSVLWLRMGSVLAMYLYRRKNEFYARPFAKAVRHLRSPTSNGCTTAFIVRSKVRWHALEPMWTSLWRLSGRLQTQV